MSTTFAVIWLVTVLAGWQLGKLFYYWQQDRKRGR